MKVDSIIVSTIVEKATNNELKKAFQEIKEWREKGFLVDGIVVRYHREYEEIVGEEQNIHMTLDAFLYEMARRFAEGK